MARTQIFTSIDFDKAGKQVGWLYLPHSVDRSAYGNLAIPIAVVRNGSGPTVLFMGGTHGDEYEGQIALTRLVRQLDPARVQGRVIVMPATNLPAALAGKRVSPIDGGNLNRAFPGDPNGTPTQMIAHYIDEVLFPLADYCHDFHAGGASLDYVPFVSMRETGNADLDRRTMAALRACGAEDGLVWSYSHGKGFALMSAFEKGIVALGGEFGGCGGVSRRGIAIVERAITGLLDHAGVVEAPKGLASPETRLWQVPARSYYALATDAGLFEPAVDLMDRVAAGAPCGRLHFVDDPQRPPVEIAFDAGGVVLAKRHLGRVERGDCLAHLATEWKA